MASKVTGQDGRSLAVAWQDGPEAYHGGAVARFPSRFMIMGPNTALAHDSIVVMIEAQVGYILQCLEWLGAGHVEGLGVREDAQRRFKDDLHRQFERAVWSGEGETSRWGLSLVPCMTWYRHTSAPIRSSGRARRSHIAPRCDGPTSATSWPMPQGPGAQSYIPAHAPRVSGRVSTPAPQSPRLPPGLAVFPTSPRSVGSIR